MIIKFKENGFFNRLVLYSKMKPTQMILELYLFKVINKKSKVWNIINLDFSIRLYGDHSPNINIYFGMFNVVFIELELYNIYHEDCE